MKSNPRKLRVCVDARLRSGSSAGVQSVVIGLAVGLGTLLDGDEEYLFLAWDNEGEWLKPFLKPNCRLLNAGPPPVNRASKIPRRLLRVWHQVSPWLGSAAVRIPKSDGRVEASGAEVMHFAHQDAFLTSVPSIYHPHDLQHLHLPQFFTPRERQRREIRYRRYCNEAAMVAVGTEWGRQDLIKHYGLGDRKVGVVPLAPVVKSYPVPTADDLGTIKAQWNLPEQFFFYAAQTWPHKNHLILLEAAAHLRDSKGVNLFFVFSGTETDHAQVIRNRAEKLRLSQQIRFVGFVSPLELSCLYRLCRAVVIPTRFEAASFPLWEAFYLGVPAACSNVTSLPRQAGDAALVFDPMDAPSVGHALERLWTDDQLCSALRERGLERVKQFTWERTARIFRAHYRRLAGRSLDEEDRSWVDSPPLL